MKKLCELYSCESEVEVKGIKINSKLVQPGDLFVCTVGVTTDRHDFIDEAIHNGAVAVVVSKQQEEKMVPVIKVENTNKELIRVCEKFYDNPLEKLKLIGVTGTDGKTTTAQIIQTLLGMDICGYIGTSGRICEKFNRKTDMTTPDVHQMYPYLKEFVDVGCQMVSLETSSEAFYRHRLDSFCFDVAVLTNITEDHLNVHKTMENYIDCKCQLFRQVVDNGLCVLNTDDPYYETVKKACHARIVSYGKKSEATLQIIDFKLYDSYTFITLKYQDKIYEVNSPLLGDFNVYNLCAALLACMTFGYTFEELIKRIDKLSSFKGRLDFIEFGQDYKIMVDYAHTAFALEKILTFLSSIKKGNLITIGGCAGGREHEKRSIMGKLMTKFSDYVIFTMDDPRYENVNTIIDELVSEVVTDNYERILDRTKAIHKALSMAKKDDIVLVVGKGSDTYMAIGNEYLPYSDYDAIKSYFNL